MKICVEKLLFHAVEHRNRSLVGFLIGLGIDLNTRHDGHTTTLERAVQKRYVEIVDLLFEHGANNWSVESDLSYESLVDLVVECGDMTMLGNF
jgi:ankyrin repeat protein